MCDIYWHITGGGDFLREVCYLVMNQGRSTNGAFGDYFESLIILLQISLPRVRVARQLQELGPAPVLYKTVKK